MDDKFLTGIVLGMLGGALIVTNSVKARQFIKDGQDRVVKTMDDMDKQNKQKQ